MDPQVLSEVEIRPPRIPVLSNVTAAPFPDDPAGIALLLSRQLTESVLWEASLGALLGRGTEDGLGVAFGVGQKVEVVFLKGRPLTVPC